MNKIQEIEEYLLKTLPPEELLAIEANLLINRELAEQAYWQQQAYSLVKDYSRRALRAEIEAVHLKIFSEEKFRTLRQKVSSIFKI